MKILFFISFSVLFLSGILSFVADRFNDKVWYLKAKKILWKILLIATIVFFLTGVSMLIMVLFQ